MKKRDKKMAVHVRSARIWLEKAERAFATDAGIKGELNLMLAEAEMKNMRKQNQYYSSIKRVLIGFSCLCVVVVIIYNGMFFVNEKNNLSTSSIQKTTSVSASITSHELKGETKKKTTQTEPIVFSDVKTHRETKQQPSSIPIRTAEVQPVVASKQDKEEKILSERQMQETVQAARVSLQRAEIQSE
ncbi:hypothetical protein [uncultured Megasphaera sp.]|uniref:hypothetical protein n=1 Tax=uncultured Megasphaera sp. TaxID=165188 RepID=UPI00259AE676|nr:hypothetical protein [uncultured Megasphaera sp.]